MNRQERNEQSLNMIFNSKKDEPNVKTCEYYVTLSDEWGTLSHKYFYTKEEAIEFANKRNQVRGENAKVYDKYGHAVQSSRKPIKSGVKMVRHYSVEVYLPFTQYNNSPYNLNGIQVNDWGVRLSGSAGGPYAAESTNIDIYNDGTVSVYDTKHHLDNTKYYNLELIHDFLNFFKENIDVMSYLDKPTATGMVSLSSADTYKIKEWADSHKSVQSSRRPIKSGYDENEISSLISKYTNKLKSCTTGEEVQNVVHDFNYDENVSKYVASIRTRSGKPVNSFFTTNNPSEIEYITDWDVDVRKCKVQNLYKLVRFELNIPHGCR